MIWLLFPIGIAVATIAMFSGIGGGVLWMPILLSLYKLPPDQAVPCALVIQVAGMASGTAANVHNRLVDGRLVLQQAAMALPLVVVGAVVAQIVTPAFVELTLGLLMFLIAYLFLRGDSFLDEGTSKARLDQGWKIGGVTATGGFLTGFLSVGIGDWLVPLFNRKCGLAMANSVATGIALMLLLSGVGAGVHLMLGAQVPWTLVAVATPGVIIGAQLGSRIHRRFSESSFKEIFVLLLLFLAAHVTFNAL